MNSLIKTVILLAFIVLCADCGRKQRTLFNFTEKESFSINRLALPAVRELQVTIKDNKTLLTWQPIEVPGISKALPMQPILIGYHVYRFIAGSFIPKRPITKIPTHANAFIDASRLKNRQHYRYMVRAVFTIDKHTVLAPASYIASSRVN